ncbi:sulfatase [Botrimarina sp.]|uniref:sulfatase n=1 Tax=Botrimarina sp. TaxID=2795802 RepID=UPI0032ECC932
MTRLRLILWLSCTPFLLGGVWCRPARAAERPNVLMIWVDDLRPEIACFGERSVDTPNLDRLARRAVRFERGYCNVPVCGASRASVMTGLRATPDRFKTYYARADRDAPEAQPLHKRLKEAGYHTVSIGKVFHVKADHADGWDENSRPRGKMAYASPAGRGAAYTTPDNRRLATEAAEDGRRGPPWEVAPVDDQQLPDGHVAAAACDAIRRLAGAEQPFFIAAGFWKPHLPFVAPEAYWEGHDPAAIALPDNFDTRPSAPAAAFTNWGELRAYAGIPRRGQVDRDTARRLIAGYRACVEFVDAQIGKVLDQLEHSGAARNTVVLLLGDHGWNLGEHGMWCKHCLFETSMRTPLLIAAPTLSGFNGDQAHDTLVEFVDIYPTVCQLCGVRPPAGLPGVSLVPTLRDPAARPRRWAVGRFHTGETIRTDRYRYSVYPEKSGVAQHMLYDHETDESEDHNLADDPRFAKIVAELRSTLQSER